MAVSDFTVLSRDVESELWAVVGVGAQTIWDGWSRSQHFLGGGAGA